MTQHVKRLEEYMASNKPSIKLLLLLLLQEQQQFILK